MIYVTATEFSILQTLCNEPKTVKDFSKILGITHSLANQRCAILLDLGLITRFDTQKHYTYQSNVNPLNLIVEDRDIVRRFRQNQNNENLKTIFIDHIPEDVKNRSVMLRNQGVPRTEIARTLNITKTELLLILSDSDDKKTKIVSKENPSENHVLRSDMKKQFQEACKTAFVLREQGHEYKEIAEILNSYGYINMHRKSFTDTGVVKMMRRNYVEDDDVEIESQEAI